MNQTIAILKKKMEEKPWLYEDEEKAVLALLEHAVAFIKDVASIEHMGEHPESAAKWLEEHGIS